MAEYPIIMKQLNDKGEYDILYPQTLGSQIQGNIPSSKIEGNIPSNQIVGTFPSTSITGQIPSSQIDGIYTADQTLTQTVAQLFNLTSGNAIPNNVFNILSKVCLLNSTNDGLVLPNGETISLPFSKVEAGTYIGTYGFGSSNPNTLSFSNPPKCVIIGGTGTDSQLAVNCVAILTPNSGNSFLSIDASGKSYGFGEITSNFNQNVVSWYSNGLFLLELTIYGLSGQYMSSGNVYTVASQLNLRINYNYIGII